MSLRKYSLGTPDVSKAVRTLVEAGVMRFVQNDPIDYTIIAFFSSNAGNTYFLTCP